jgi:hypothetical protein
VRSWAPAGPYPYAIEAVGDTVWIGDLETGEVRAHATADPSAVRVVTVVAGGVASLRRTSRGTLTVMEQRGAQRLLEIASDGSQREIWRAPSWVSPTIYRQHDTDSTGAIGPVDDSLVGYGGSSGAYLFRISFDGALRRLWSENGAASQGGRGRQGPADRVSDPGIHYGPAWVRISREFGEALLTGGVGGTAVLFRPRQPGEPNGAWTVAQGAAATAGRDIWKRGTIPGGPLRPSFWHLAGHEGAHFTGPSPRDNGVSMQPEELVALGDEGLLRWMQAGGRGETPRPEITLQAAKDVRQFLTFATDAGWKTAYVPPAVTPPDPPDPPDTTGPDIQVTGVPLAPVAEDFLVEAMVTDPAGVASVALTVATDPPQVLAAPPYRWAVDVDPLEDGEHALTVTATDSLGNQRAVVTSFRVDHPDPPDEVPQALLILEPGVTYRVTGGKPV